MCKTLLLELTMEDKQGNQHLLSKGLPPCWHPSAHVMSFPITYTWLGWFTNCTWDIIRDLPCISFCFKCCITFCKIIWNTSVSFSSYKLHRTEMFPLTVPEARNLKSRCSRAMRSLKFLGILLSCLSLVLCLPATLGMTWLVDTSLRTLPLFFTGYSPACLCDYFLLW